MKVELKAKVVDVHLNGSTIYLEFGRTQCNMDFSKNGTINRKLKLEKGSKVKVTIEKL